MILNERRFFTSNEIRNEIFRDQHPWILERLRSGIGAVLDDKSLASQHIAGNSERNHFRCVIARWCRYDAARALLQADRVDSTLCVE